MAQIYRLAPQAEMSVADSILKACVNYGSALPRGCHTCHASQKQGRERASRLEVGALGPLAAPSARVLVACSWLRAGGPRVTHAPARAAGRPGLGRGVGGARGPRARAPQLTPPT